MFTQKRLVLGSMFRIGLREIKAGEIPMILEGGGVISARRLFFILEGSKEHLFSTVEYYSTPNPPILAKTDAKKSRRSVMSGRCVPSLLGSRSFSQISPAVIVSNAALVVNGVNWLPSRNDGPRDDVGEDGFTVYAPRQIASFRNLRASWRSCVSRIPSVAGLLRAPPVVVAEMVYRANLPRQQPRIGVV